jgi:hypothetical protein
MLIVFLSPLCDERATDALVRSVALSSPHVEARFQNVKAEGER